MAIPYSNASLFVAENPSLRDFSMIVFSGDSRTSPTPDPLWFVVPSTYTFQHGGPGIEDRKSVV